MNYRSGFFRLWIAGALLWTAFWAGQYLCLTADVSFDGTCGARSDVLLGGLLALGALLACWIARGLLSPRSLEIAEPVTRMVKLKRAALR